MSFMDDHSGLAAFTVSTTLVSAGAFDRGLQYQLELRDDATLAVWSSVGLETITLVAVLLKAPAEAFQDGALPSHESLSTFEARTAGFSELVDTAKRMYPEGVYPPAGLSFMREVRNKLLHVGSTRRVGLVGMSLELIADTGRWLEGLDLPVGPLRHPPHVLDATRIEHVPTALQSAAARVARDNADHLERSLHAGSWDDTPSLRAIAQRELGHCQMVSGSSSQ